MKFVFAGMYIVTIMLFATTSNSSPAATSRPCECCTTDHESTCLNCDNIEETGKYNCGTIDPIEPEI